MSQRTPLPPASWYRQPIWIGLLGLALMVGGWRLGSFQPGPSPQRQQQASQLAELRRLAEDPALARRLDQIQAHASHEAPYRVPGKLLFLAGMFFFIGAAVQMYRTPTPLPQDEQIEGESSS